jgi:hypothetical protein
MAANKLSATAKAIKPASKKRAAAKVAPENQTPSEAIAFTLGIERVDLAPSINRIMESDLTEAGKLQAITLFKASLTATGDPNRNPAVAIEQGRLADA